MLRGMTDISNLSSCLAFDHVPLAAVSQKPPTVRLGFGRLGCRDSIAGCATKVCRYHLAHARTSDIQIA